MQKVVMRLNIEKDIDKTCAENTPEILKIVIPG